MHTTEDLHTAQTLKEIPEGQKLAFRALLLLRKVQIRKTKTGDDFLIVELGDKSASFSFACFQGQLVYSIFEKLPEGSALEVSGTSGHYGGRFAPDIEMVQALDTDFLEANPQLLEKLIASSYEPAEKLWEELVNEHSAAIEHAGLRKTVETLLKAVENVFKTTPGAISMHHAYLGGLLEHTVHVVRAGRALLPLYPEVNADLALAGMIVHDVGKTLEYEGTFVASRSRIGHLQGHVVLGYRMVRKAALQSNLEESLLEQLEHIVLSHQGELEWGAAVLAATPEAVFVSLVDNLDAKMGMVQQTLKETPIGQTFSEHVPGLKTKLVPRSVAK